MGEIIGIVGAAWIICGVIGSVGWNWLERRYFIPDAWSIFYPIILGPISLLVVWVLLQEQRLARRRP